MDLAKKLLERGDEVVGLDNINDYYDINLKYGRLKELGIIGADASALENTFIQSTCYPKHKFLKLDLADREGMTKLFEKEKFDAVMHLAAQAGVRYSLENPHAYIDSNVVGFLNILEGCRHSGVKNLSYASSSSVYGLNQSQPFKTTAENYGNHHPPPPIPAKACISCQVSSDISNSFLSLNAFWAINSTFNPSKKKYLVPLK